MSDFKDKAKDAIDHAAQSAKNVAGKVVEGAKDAGHKAGDAMKHAGEVIKDDASKVAGKVKEGVHEAGDAMKHAGDKVKHESKYPTRWRLATPWRRPAPNGRAH